MSLELRYGMCCDLPSTRAEMTFPSVLRERLIFVASFSLSPEACVLLWRSDPARSTRLSFPTRMCASASDAPSGVSLVSTVMVKMECDRDDSEFISVAPTLRFFFPTSRTCRISATDFTTNVVSPWTYTPRSGVSFRAHVLL